MRTIRGIGLARYGATMGLLTQGTVLSWAETRRVAEHVRRHGLLQFLELHRRAANRSSDPFVWGDEIEFQLVEFDRERKRVQLLGEAPALLSKLPDDLRRKGMYRPEYATYQLEGLSRVDLS